MINAIASVIPLGTGKSTRVIHFGKVATRQNGKPNYKLGSTCWHKGNNHEANHHQDVIRATAGSCQYRYPRRTRILFFNRTINLHGAITMKAIAHILTKIPSDCPFARDVRLGGFTFHIPPLCKLNPFFNQLMAAKWWALQYLEVRQ